MSKVRKWIMEERLGHQKPDCKTAGSDPRIKLFGQTISCSGTTEMVVSAGEARPRSPIPEVIDESTPRSGEEFGSSSGSNSGSEEDTKGGESGRNDSPDLKSEEKESKKMQQDQNSVQNVHQNQHNQQAKQKLEPGAPEGEGEDTGMGISTDKTPKKPDKPVPCPRCDSLDTKFCYYNNYNVNQPRHFCKNCQRYWTAGGMLRNVPVGAGRRKNKHSNSAQQWHVMQDGLVRSDAPDHGAKSRLDMCAEPSSSGSIITNLSHGTGPGFNLAFSSLMPESSHAVELPAKQVCKRSDSEVSSGSPVGSETPVIASENAAEAWGGSVPVALLDKAWSFGYNLAMKSSAGGGSGNIPSVGNIPSLWPWPGAVWGAGGWGSANWPMAMAMTKLGKHEREKPYPEGSGDGFLWVPKTQRCGEPANPVTRVLSELSQSPPSLHPGSIFKAFQPKPDSSCHRLHAHSDANPAAIARSVSFQESN